MGRRGDALAMACLELLLFSVLRQIWNFEHYSTFGTTHHRTEASVATQNSYAPTRAR
jgi:hypothetical protein